MAFIAKQRYKLDIAPRGGWVIVYASQHDDGAREIEFEITNQGRAFSIPASINVSVQGIKSNGSYFSHSCSYSGNIVTMALADDMTDIIGKSICVLKFTNSSQQKLATAKFVLNVDTDSSSEGVIIDTEAEEIFNQMLNEIRAQAASISADIAELQSMVGSPLVASTVSAMTNHNKIYVYTGSESGYTNGNWYYWNGSAWTSGGVYNSTAFETDKTLSIENMAADAKKTGNEITNLREDFNQEVVVVENTNFANRIAVDYSVVPVSDIPNLVTYSNKGIASNKIVATNNYNCYAFMIPYEDFSFDVNSTTPVYLINSLPSGTSGEVIDGSALTWASTDSTYKRYTVNAPKGTYVLFELVKSYGQEIKTTWSNPFTMSGLELNSYQDWFARYSERGESSAFIPVAVTKVTGKLVNTTTGGLSSNASYDTYYFQCPASAVSVTCTNGFRAVITSKDPTEINSNGYFIRTVYEYESERVNTFTVNIGQFVVISINVNDYPSINLATDMVKHFMLPTLRLSYGQKNSFYRFGKSGSATYLYIYYVSGNKIVQWQLHNVPAEASNSNTWQIGHVMGYDFNGLNISNGVELVGGGEFELAFKEHGATDFCGGNNHGDENTDFFTLHIDGKAIDLANVDNDFHIFDRIDAIEEATVNRCNAPDEDILSHQKIWTFTNGKVIVRQTIKYLESLQVDGALVCMFAANRSSFPYGVRQGGVDIEDMSEQGYTHILTKENSVFYEMYGNNATAKVSSSISNGNIASGLWINDTADLNKLYYEAYADATSVNPVSVPSGTVLTVNTEYEVAYS